MSLLEKASLIVTPNAYKTSKLYSVVPNTTLGDMDVVRATTATRVNSSGLISSVGVNIPRIDYTNGSCPSILVEPQRTNLALRSEEFDNATWTTNGLNVTVSPNATTAPDGSNSADAIFTTNSVGVHYIQQRTGTATAGTTYTMSVYVKKLGYDYCQILTSNTGTGIGVFRFSTKTLTIDGPQVVANSGKVTEMADGWFRIQISILPLSSAGWRWWIQCLNDSAQESFTGDVTKGLYVWGFQFETGANATSYIPTTSASVTRNADVISKTGISSLIGQTDGTIFVDANLSVNANERRLLSIIGTAGESQRIIIWTLNNILYTTFNAATVNLGSFPIGAAKIAIGYTISGGNTTYSIKVNNNALITGTAASSPTSLESLALGSQLAASLTLNDRINLVTLWKERLSNDQLELLAGDSFYTYDEMAIALNYNIQ